MREGGPRDQDDGTPRSHRRRDAGRDLVALTWDAFDPAFLDVHHRPAEDAQEEPEGLAAGRATVRPFLAAWQVREAAAWKDREGGQPRHRLAYLPGGWRGPGPCTSGSSVFRWLMVRRSPGQRGISPAASADG